MKMLAVLFRFFFFMELLGHSYIWISSVKKKKKDSSIDDILTAPTLKIEFLVCSFTTILYIFWLVCRCTRLSSFYQRQGFFFPLFFSCRFVYSSIVSDERLFREERIFLSFLFFYSLFFCWRQFFFFFDVSPLIFWRRPSYRHCLDAWACQANQKMDGERKGQEDCWC